MVAFLALELLRSTRLATGPLDLQLRLATQPREKPYSNTETDAAEAADDPPAAISLVKEYLRIAEKGGSDVRLDVGIPFRPGAWPRSGARPYQWQWEVVHGYPWRHSQGVHINKLELLAVFGALKWRARAQSQQRTRFIHLVDSQAVGAIVTKGRTSSKLLRSALRRMNALVVAGQLYPAYLYAYSEDNLADMPSRYRWHNQPRKMPTKRPPLKKSLKRHRFQTRRCLLA